MTYFGIIGLLAIYFNDFIGLNDLDAGRMVGILTGGITLAMLLLGATVDIVGVRKSLLNFPGPDACRKNITYDRSDIVGTTGMWSSSHSLAMFGILWIILGYGIDQPACYAAVKQFTDEKPAAMGYTNVICPDERWWVPAGSHHPSCKKILRHTWVFWVYVALQSQE